MRYFRKAEFFELSKIKRVLSYLLFSKNRFVSSDVLEKVCHIDRGKINAVLFSNLHRGAVSRKLEGKRYSYRLKRPPYIYSNLLNILSEYELGDI